MAGRAIRLLTEDEVEYLRNYANKCDSNAVAEQIKTYQGHIGKLAKIICGGIKKGRKPMPPTFTGESSYTKPGCTIEIPRKRIFDKQPGQEDSYVPFENTLFAVNTMGEVVVDRISEVLGW